MNAALIVTAMSSCLLLMGELIPSTSPATHFTQRTSLITRHLSVNLTSGDYRSLFFGIARAKNSAECVQFGMLSSVKPELLFVKTWAFPLPLRLYSCKENDGGILQNCYPVCGLLTKRLKRGGIL
ncbi:unnamed protein product [Hydatigera taeniaeformis]|uniref:Secreted protein n=1 Tax=Hydatigena taeniaeformis TaxID=6205 RepID=A0A0R3X567_HYDTA|nr:unnamed protein product [Hydatigera taeniaeformis]